MENMFDMTDMNAMITGGGKGLGRGIAEGFLKEGANVIITGSSDAIYETEAEFKDAGYRGSIKAIHMDMLDRKQRGEAFDDCIEYFKGRLDVLVNNAGILIFQSFRTTPLKKIETLVMLHVVTMTKLCRLFAEDMCERGRGYILNMSSMSAWMAMPVSSAGPVKASMHSSAALRYFSISFCITSASGSA